MLLYTVNLVQNFKCTLLPSDTVPIIGISQKITKYKDIHIRRFTDHYLQKCTSTSNVQH